MIGSRPSTVRHDTTQPHAWPFRGALVESGEDIGSGALVAAFHRCGGSVGGDAWASRMAAFWPQPVSVLARWIVDRRVVHFSRHSMLMLPCFQFDPVDCAIRPSAARVIEQLRGVLDDGELAQWFVQPHGHLQGGIPALALASDADAVFEAALATHFLCGG